MIDLSEIEPKTILQHPRTKQIFLVTGNETQNIRRLRLFDIRNQRELSYEVTDGRPLIVDSDLNQIKQGFSTSTPATDFRPIQIDIAEKYCLGDKDYQVLKFKIDELDNPKIYPDIFVKT